MMMEMALGVPNDWDPYIAMCRFQRLPIMMIVIGALIGTEDLGQLIMGAISRKNGAGLGLTLGIFVSFMCLAADNLIRTWSDERKKALGIS